MSQVELCPVVAIVTVGHEIVQDEPTGAAADLTEVGCHIITGVIVVVATQTTQLALQHAQWRHLTTHTHTHVYMQSRQSLSHNSISLQLTN